MDNRKTINTYLGNRGLATLDEPQGLMAQLGYLVDDDQHFKGLINKCAPEERRNLYEALRPHLRFEPRPLDVYIAELGMEAEIQQLPTITTDGKLQAFRPTEIRSAIGEAIHDHRLEVVCRRCTKQEFFYGERKADAVEQAREAGWTYDALTGTGREICPDCLK
jgi:hypothetical protein